MRQKILWQNLWKEFWWKVICAQVIMFRRKVAGTGGDNDSDKKKILKQLMRRGGEGWWGRGICWNLQNFLWSCQKILRIQAFSWNKSRDKCIWGDKVEWLKIKTSNNVVTLKKTCQKLSFSDIWKSWFLYFALQTFNFNFYKKNITTPQNYLSFPRGKSFLKQMLFHSLYEANIGFGGTVFS